MNFGRPSWVPNYTEILGCDSSSLTRGTTAKELVDILDLHPIGFGTTGHDRGLSKRLFALSIADGAVICRLLLPMLGWLCERQTMPLNQED